MKRRIGDDDAADGDGIELGDRGQGTGAPDLDLDVVEDGRRLLGRKFVRDRPARRARDETQPLLQGKIVDLIDDTIDVVAEARPLLFDEVIVLDQPSNRIEALHQPVDRKAMIRDRRHDIGLGLARNLARLAPGIGEEFQLARAGDRRIELAQGAGSGIARIGVDLAAALGLPSVEFGKGIVAHIDLAPHLEDVGRRALQAIRNIGNGAGVAGHILARRPVAACRRRDHLALLVADRERQAIDLRLGGDRERRVVLQLQEAADAFGEIGDILVGKGVVEREHRQRMADLAELLRDLGPDPNGRRVVADQARETGLDRRIASAQGVIVGVGDGRRVLPVIASIMLGDLGGEPLQLLGRILRAHRLHVRLAHRLFPSPADALATARHEPGARRVLDPFDRVELTPDPLPIEPFRLR